jgi:hypothetical protein
MSCVKGLVCSFTIFYIHVRCTCFVVVKYMAYNLWAMLNS